jgi:hypothetical protein
MKGKYSKPVEGTFSTFVWFPIEFPTLPLSSTFSSSYSIYPLMWVVVSKIPQFINLKRTNECQIPDESEERKVSLGLITQAELVMRNFLILDKH